MSASREYPSKPMVAASALIHRGSKILLLRRARPPNQGKWAFPGGLVELGESPRETALREAWEETGLRIRIESLLDVTTDVHLDARRKVRYHFIVVDFLAGAALSRVRINSESTEYGWFTPDEVGRIDASPNIKQCVTKFSSGLRNHSPHSSR